MSQRMGHLLTYLLLISVVVTGMAEGHSSAKEKKGKGSYSNSRCRP